MPEELEKMKFYVSDQYHDPRPRITLDEQGWLPTSVKLTFS